MEDTGLQELVTAGGEAVYRDAVMSVHHGEPAPEDVTRSLGVGCPLHAQTSYALTLTSHHLLLVSPLSSNLLPDRTDTLKLDNPSSPQHSIQNISPHQDTATKLELLIACGLSVCSYLFTI